jgi:glutamate-1-semialdehyde 2,1-aminomutase
LAQHVRIDQGEMTMENATGQVTLRDLSGSVDYLKRARVRIPLGASSSKRATQMPTPIVVARAQGSRVHDVDGNEFIDYVGGGGPLILGHQPDPVVAAVREQLDRGCQFAAPHEAELELAERVAQSVPSADMVAFLSSGSEAVHAAIAVARGATGRSEILKFDGHYDGWIAPVEANMPGLEPGEGAIPYAVKPVAGWPPSPHVVICPWNDVEALAEIMERAGSSLAAVIMEPIACNAGALSPRPGFLERARELCDETGALLIFDEVITGFRMALGGAQERLGVLPDITVLAKALASGFPISAVAGRRAFMLAAAEGDVRLRGTYNANAVSVAAANATVDELQAGASELYPALESRSALLADGIREAGAEVGAALHINQVGSVVWLLLGLERQPETYREVARIDGEAHRRLDAELTKRGILTIDAQRLFVSTAHTDDDVARTIVAFREALEVAASG